MPLDRSIKDEMISAYLAGDKVAPLAERYGVPRSTLYAVLRAAGIEPSRKTRSTPLSSGHYCPVCGDLKPPPASGHRSGGWWQRRTCSDPSCLSVFHFLEVAPRPRTDYGIRCGELRLSPKDEALDPDEMDVLRAQLEIDEAVERAFETFQDERLADTPETARRFEWSGTSMVTVALRLNGCRSKTIGLTLPTDAREGFLQRFCGGDPSVLDGFDLVYAWRCECPQQTTFSVQSLDAFPTADGFYGSCPRCYAIALQVGG